LQHAPCYSSKRPCFAGPQGMQQIKSVLAMPV
jgi:hypothetical protein